MSKVLRALAIVALAMTVSAGAAEAAGHHGGGGHGWHGGGGWGWGGGWGLGWGVPYYYPGPYYYGYGPGCGWTRVRVWRGGHWVLRRAWRCW